MSVAFSSKDEEVIKRQIDVSSYSDPPRNQTVKDFYETDRCAKWINDNKFEKVGLQFPDGYLKDAAEVSKILETETSSQMFISGDTSYGSCCVDEITAEHVSCNSIIHFGHACLSPTSRLPVLYVFGKLPCNVDAAAEAFREMFSEDDHVIIIYEVFFSYIIGDLQRVLEPVYKNIVVSNLCMPDVDPTSTDMSSEKYSTIKKCGRFIQIPKSKNLSSYQIFYIGSENRTLMNLMLSFNYNKFYSFDPKTKVHRQETLDVNKYLRKRYYYIEKAKDANIIGILVGTLGVAKYLEAIDHLKKIIKESGKKSYTLVVGKPNPAKLANFAEIELYVCVSCPECSLVDSHDFYQPIVTPFEMETALNKARDWTGQYITDFRELLPGAASYIPFQVPADGETYGDVSLVTGKIRISGDMKDTANSSNNELVSRSDLAVANTFADGFTSRLWKGLEQRLGETPVAEISKGRTGIASGYEDENHNTSS